MSPDNSFYPQIFFPSAYKEIIECNPKLTEPPVIPNKPVEPSNEYLKPNGDGCMSSTNAFLLIAIGIVFFIIASNNKQGAQIILGGLVFISVGAFGLWFNYSVKADYKKEKDTYDKELFDLKKKY